MDTMNPMIVPWGPKTSVGSGKRQVAGECQPRAGGPFYKGSLDH